MVRATIKNGCHKRDSCIMNQELAANLIQEMVRCGVRSVCFCPGARNSPLLSPLKQHDRIKLFNFFDERSAAFFALGKSRISESPVAVITTSGTAAGELLPASMEGYYSGDPLLLVTADRPRRSRGSGAPQAAEQVGLFGVYAPWNQDLAFGEICQLSEWNQKAPAHLNVCFEEPKNDR